MVIEIKGGIFLNLKCVGPEFAQSAFDRILQHSHRRHHADNRKDPDADPQQRQR